jgi:hypothetical protein
MTRPGRFSFAFLLVAAVACSKAQPEPTKAVASATANASANAEAEKLAATKIASALATIGSHPSAGIPFGERFATEAASRPKGGVRAEKVHDAWTKAGIAFGHQKQHLGQPFEASYCIGGKVGEDIATSVCEYTDEKAAESGRQTSLKAFAAVPGREIVRNNATTLTVRIATPSDAAKATAEKMKKLFAELKPEQP